MQVLAKKHRGVILIGLSLVSLLSLATNLLVAQQVNASVANTPYLSEVYNDKIYKDLSAHQHYWWLYSCFQNIDIDKVTETEVDSWDFFEGSGLNSPIGAMYGTSDDKTYSRKCNDQSIVKTAFTYLGYEDSQSREVFCFIEGAQYKDGRDSDGGDCIAGAGGHDWDNNASKDEIIKWYKEKIYPKKPALTAPASYMRSFASLVEGCDVSFDDDTTYKSAGEVPGADDGSAGTKYAMPIITKSGDTYKIEYVLGVGLEGDTDVAVVAADKSNGGVKYQDCNSLVNEARDNVAAYMSFIQRNGSTETGESTLEDGGGDPETTSCAVDGIGWIVCPVITFLGTLNDAAFGFLNNFLTVSPRIFSDPATKSAWEAFRNLANIAFVVAFLVIIYSQITGGGITNYGMKKLLPKLIVAAILVNISFYVCAVLVDLSNIVGSSTYSLLKNDINTGTGDTGGGTLSTIWSTAGAVVLGAGAVVGLIALIIFAPMSFLAFGLIILILIARQAFVVLLIVVSPLAFVAYLLPNTEDWFKKWWKSLVAMLMVFPIIALVFGGSTLASTILMSVSQDNFGGGDDEQMLKIIAAGVLAIPLFAVPLLLKGSMSAAGSIGTKLAGLQDRTNRGAGKAIKDGRLGEAKTAFDARRQGRRLDRRVGEGKRFGVIPSARINKAIDKSRFGRYIGGDRGAAQATSAVHHEFDEEVKRQKTTMGSMTNDDLLKILDKGEGSAERQSAAAGIIMSRQHRESHLKALDIAGRRGKDSNDTAIDSVQKQMSYDMKDKPFALGDQAAGQLQVGTYGKATSHTGEPQNQFGDINKELQDRVGTKLSAQSLATMNPDEMKLIHAAALSGQLQPNQMNSLAAAIDGARDNKQMDALIKPEARALHQQILDKQAQSKAAQDAAASSYGPNI